ncbi:hypothetical protein COE15_27835 [Bacillus cereus]|uniref:DUF3982 domain-containing protein n=1 Tax=Bacillus sp. 166amftsu TaxID=1761753 RepID=UPI000B80FA06|nr:MULTISPECIES: DUF3982 domain-containing protein [Bacillus]PGX89572.1 hypothetical protein COE15_27835 [Bacillus cereus]
MTVVSPVSGMVIVLVVDWIVIVVLAFKVSIVKNVMELPIAFAEKLSEGMLPLMEMPKPKGADPENNVEAEKSMI